jgi:hypothetical protein
VTPVPLDAPVLHNNRRFMWTVAIFFACGVVVAVVAGMAMSTARQADQRSIATSQALLVEANQQVIANQVSACESRNKAREDTRRLFQYIGQLTAQNRPPGEPPTPTAVAFYTYLEEAYDPINCVWGSPDFGIDVDPPTTLPATATVAG